MSINSDFAFLVFF